MITHRKLRRSAVSIVLAAFLFVEDATRGKVAIGEFL
jgi:hypothetical protein